MSGFFYKLGKMAGPHVRKAKWCWASATDSESEAIAAEEAVGKDLASQVRRIRPRYEDNAIDELLYSAGGQLTERIKNNKRNFSFTCLSGQHPEAFCLPGGFIFISASMVFLCDKEADEVGSVLAHEIAHIIKGHSMERMAGNAVIKAAAAGTGQYAVRGVLERVGWEFLTKAYSREHELEADELALRLLRAAGFDPQASVRVFEKLADRHKSEGPLKYFSTHPEPRERISRLQKMM